MTSEIDLARFASLVSHELAQPLHVATGYLEMVQSEFGSEIDPMALQWLEQSSGSLEKVVQLVQDMVTFARAGANVSTNGPVDLNEVVGSAVAAHEVEIDARDASVEVRSMPIVMGDEEQLGRVLENLIGNVLKFVPSATAPRVTVSADEIAEGVVVNVDDNGPGIAVADREYVLELFGRVASEDVPGSGLGLAVCQRIIEAHGGRIWIEDSELGGARARFLLPGDRHETG